MFRTSGSRPKRPSNPSTNAFSAMPPTLPYIPPTPAESIAIFPSAAPTLWAAHKNGYQASSEAIRPVVKQTGPTKQASARPGCQPVRKEPVCVDPAKYTKPFCDFLTNNPTVYHAVAAVAEELKAHGFTKLSERQTWPVLVGGKYYVERNGSSLVAFAVGGGYKLGCGVPMIAGHIDALTARLKPIPKLHNKAGYVQLGVAPYAGALNETWWDRDLGVGGRVLVIEHGKVVSKLVKLDWPIARIPTLAPHFGPKASGPFNKETQMVPIIGLDHSDIDGNEDKRPTIPLGWRGLLYGDSASGSRQDDCSAAWHHRL